MRAQARLLKKESELRAAIKLIRLFPIPKHLSISRLQQTSEDAQKGSLAGAGRTHHCQGGTRRKRETEIPNDALSAQHYLEVFDFESHVSILAEVEKQGLTEPDTFLTRSGPQLDFPQMDYVKTELNPDEAKVFTQLRIRKAMPLLEIAGLTGIYGQRLQSAISRLVSQHLVTVQPGENIVTISGKYF